MDGDADELPSALLGKVLGRSGSGGGGSEGAHSTKRRSDDGKKRKRTEGEDGDE